MKRLFWCVERIYSKRHYIYEINNIKDNFSPKMFLNINGEHEE
jgi:hypothetical protein